MLKIVKVALISILCLVGIATFSFGSKGDDERIEIVKISLKTPSAYLPSTRYEFTPVVEGQEVTYNFVIQNKGTAPLKVQKVKTD